MPEGGFGATVVYDKTMLLDEELYDESVPVDQQCAELCMQAGTNTVQSCVLTAIDGEPAVSCEVLATQDCGGIGRRPAGLAPAIATAARGALARHFSAAAHLEAASVPAFETMARELAAKGQYAILEVAIGTPRVPSGSASSASTEGSSTAPKRLKLG